MRVGRTVLPDVWGSGVEVEDGDARFASTRRASRRREAGGPGVLRGRRSASHRDIVVRFGPQDLSPISAAGPSADPFQPLTYLLNQSMVRCHARSAAALL